MTSIDFPFQTIGTLTFTPRPQPLPANLRPIYRIALIVLILKNNCRGNTASLLKLQFFNWLLKSPSLQKSILDRLSDKSVFTIELIHIDPMVNLALKYACADKLILVTNSSKYQLTEKGLNFADNILRDKSLMKSEKAISLLIGQRVSEVKLKGELI